MCCITNVKSLAPREHCEPRAAHERISRAALEPPRPCGRIRSELGPEDSQIRRSVQLVGGRFEESRRC